MINPSEIEGVEKFLETNKNTIYSLRNIKYKLYKNDIKIKRKRLIHILRNSKKIELVEPIEVGSGKVFLHIYKYKSESD